MHRDTLRDMLKLINNSTSNSLDPQEREIFYAERRRLAALLRYEIQHSKVDDA